MDILVKALGVVVVFGALATLLGYVWLAGSFFTNKDSEIDGFSILSLVTICCPILPFFVFRLKRPEKEPLILLAGGIAVSLLGLTGIDHFSDKTSSPEALISNSALPVTSATPPASPRNTPPPPVKVPEMDGKPVDLSSIMGRARALAEKWQHEATLTGIDVTHMTANAVRTDAGGKVTVSFGPSPFEPAPRGSSSFLVTYDQGGLKGAPSNARPGKALPEPMCAPERIPALTGGPANISLRYALGADGRPAWLVSDPAAPRAKLRTFDPNGCQELRTR